MSNKHVGDYGENLAAAYLEQHGYVLFERNYRFERAEVDLICFEPGGEVVFVEVKTRQGLEFGRPEDAVTPEKQQQIARVAEAFLYERRLSGVPCRFDVVAILLEKGEPAIEHFKNAFWAP